MNQLESYRIFKKEFKKLEKYHHSSKFSINKLAELKQVFKKEENAKILLEYDISLKGPYGYKQSVIKGLERTLNQQSLVHSITLLEVFFTNLYRDIFIYTKAPFKDNSRVFTFSYSHLLSMDSISDVYNQIINKECRNLTSGGINIFIRTFKKRFNVDLLNIEPGHQKLIEYHDIRHLIVHRAGKTDEQFRKKYNTKKAGVSINNDFVETLFSDLKKYVKNVHSIMINYLDQINNNPPKIEFERIIKIKIEILSHNFDVNIINPKYEFWVKDKFEILKNLLIENKTLDRNTFELKLAGQFDQIKSYMKILKYQVSVQKINLTIINDYINEQKNAIDKPQSITPEIIDSIKTLLPSPLRPFGIHKEIAYQLGLTNKIVYRAIYLIDHDLTPE